MVNALPDREGERNWEGSGTRQGGWVMRSFLVAWLVVPPLLFWSTAKNTTRTKKPREQRHKKEEREKMKAEEK